MSAMQMLQQRLYQSAYMGAGYYALTWSGVMDKLLPAYQSELYKSLTFGAGAALVAEGVRMLAYGQKTYIEQGYYTLVADEALFTSASMAILVKSGLDAKVYQFVQTLNLVGLPNEVVVSVAMGVLLTVIQAAREYLSAYYKANNLQGMYWITNPATMAAGKLGLA